MPGAVFVFHHHLNRMELAPADALRAAQLARHVREPGLEDPYAWAAFTHRGR
jgi:CHAT domain-containing protein